MTLSGAVRVQLQRVRLSKRLVLIAGGLMLALLIWFVGPVIAIAGWAPLVGRQARVLVILLICFAILSFYLFRELRKRRHNADLITDLRGAGDAQTPPSEDYSAEDIKAMNERAKAALEMLRTARIGKDKEFVYELPWYLFIGPPGAGKTTALHNAGLRFPVAQHAEATPLRGVGGTRNCEWWFTDQAVMIDTAGRYTVQDSEAASDSKSWQGFLDILTKFRPRQPVTGVIVALSVSDLIGDESVLAAHGRAIRARLNEIGQKLGVRPPVYVVITKLDLLAGFTEFFDDMGQKEREQVWGNSFSLEESRGAGVAAKFPEAFSGLVERLNERLFARLQAERDVSRRALVFGFPQQLVGLEGPLTQLLTMISRETKYEPTPLIRGIYFTSATRFGRPIDRLMGAVAAKFGLAVGPTSGEGQGAGRSYFLHDLLQEVVFKEGALAERNPKSEMRRMLRRNGAIIAVAVVLVLLAGAWLVNFLHTSALIDQLSKQTAQLQKTTAALPGGDVSDSDLTQILPALDQARELPFASTAPKAEQPWPFSFGLGRTHAMRSQVDAAYRTLLDQQMLPRIILSLEDQLRSSMSSNGAGAGDNRPEIYNILRTYLMLGRAPGAPLRKSEIELWFANNWAAKYPSSEDDSTRASLMRHLEALLTAPITPPSLDRDLIQQAREQIKSLGPGERAYARMLTDPSFQDLPSFNLVDLPSVGESGLFARRSGKSLALGVPGLYRRQAFYTTVLPAIGKAAGESVNEAWVTDDKPVTGALPLANEIGRTKDEILIAYLKDFTRQWDDFINDIAISGQHPVEERILIATRPPSPVRQLINALASETNLTPTQLSTKSNNPAMAAVRVGALFSPRIYHGLNRANSVGYAVNNGQSPSAPVGPLDEVIAHFQWLQNLNPSSGPSPLDTALQALAGVGDSAVAAKSAAGLGDPLLQRTKTSAAMEATAKLDQASAGLPPVVQGMFTGFVRASSDQLNKSVRQSIQQQYASELLPQCQAILAQGFPFRDSDHQVSLDDFSRLLRPSGLLDQFVQSNLSGLVDTSRGQWEITQAGRAVDLHAASMADFQRAARIRTRMFLPGDVRPNVRFMLEPVELTGGAGGGVLSIDGVSASFDNNNRHPTEMRWPGANAGVTLTFQKKGGGAPSVKSWPGEFGLFEMVKSARVLSSSSKSLTFQVGDETNQATFTLRFLNTDNPFVQSELRSFACPANL